MKSTFAPGWGKSYKALNPDAKEQCDIAIELILKNPALFKKRRDLEGSRMYKSLPFPPGAVHQDVIIISFEWEPPDTRDDRLNVVAFEAVIMKANHLG